MTDTGITLRPLTSDDIDERYLSWFRDGTVTSFLEAKNITREDAIEHLEHGQKTGTYTVYAIIDQASGLHIGNLKLGPINWKHRFSGCVAVIGAREFWGKGLGVAAIRAGLRIAFDELDLRKISGQVVADNKGAWRAYEAAGFVIEGRLLGQHLVDGKPADLLAVACYNPRYFPPADA